ncbi:MAG: hypothetical protein QXD03_04480 [Candidatus Anstonellales archaeon]
MRGIIVGIDKNGSKDFYRVIIFEQGKGINDWKFIKQMISGEDLVRHITGGKLTLMNGTVEGGKVVGNTGGFSRFNNGVNRPLVVISEILVEGTNEVKGYKVASYDGVVKNIMLKDLIAYCRDIVSKGGVPLQNAQYVSATEGQRDFIRSYPGAEFIKEYIPLRKNPHAEAAIDKKVDNKSNTTNLEDIFTPEQLEQLKLGKKNGVDIKVYANPKFTPEQMKFIRECLEEGINAKLFADPAYSIEVMMFLRGELKYGYDIRPYLNPKYTLEQLMEISIGIIAGVDISKFADPKLTPKEMFEIRIKLEKEMWKEHPVDTHDNWWY